MTSLQVLQNKAAKIILDSAFYSSATHALACVQTSPISFVSRGEGPFSASNKGNRRRLHSCNACACHSQVGSIRKKAFSEKMYLCV